MEWMLWMDGGTAGERQSHETREKPLHSASRYVGLTTYPGLQRCTRRRRQWLHWRDKIHDAAMLASLWSKPVAHALYAKGKFGLNLALITPKNRREEGSHKNQAFETSSRSSRSNLVVPFCCSCRKMKKSPSFPPSLHSSLSPPPLLHAIDTIAETEFVAAGDKI